MKAKWFSVALAATAFFNASAVDVAFLKELIAIPSETRDMKECNRATDAMKVWFERHGVCCTVIETDVGRRFLYASTTPGLEHDYVFVTHIDVVPAIEKSQYVPRIEGDTIWGRGACDTKGNAVMIAQVLANLVGKASVGAVISTDEEGGSGWTYGTAEYAVVKGVKPRKMVLVGDSAGEAPGQLFVAEKGHLRITITAHGKGGHSSIPWACDNPIPKLFAGYAKILEAFPNRATAEDNWHDVISATVLKGSDAMNIIPDKASMTLSYRYITPGDDLKMVEKIRALTGLEVTIPKKYLKPVVNKEGDPKIAALLAAMKAKWPNGNIRASKMSAATDAWQFADFHLPTVIFAADAYGAHAKDERGSLSSLKEYAEMFTHFILTEESK